MEEYIMAQYALDRVLSVAGTDAVTENILFYADQIVDPSLSFTSETEDIVDALNNVVMVMENGRGATFGASNAFFNTQLLAAQVGGEVTTGDADITKYEVVTVNNGKVELTNDIPVDAQNKFKGKVYALADDGSLTSATEITATYVAGTAGGEGTPSVKEHLTVTTEAKRVLVVYTATITANEKISAFADAKNKLMNVTAEVLLRELCNEELYYAYLVMRGKLSGEAEWSMTRDGNHAFEIRCFPEYCGDKSLVDVIIVKG
jgi:hypothetical protein